MAAAAVLLTNSDSTTPQTQTHVSTQNGLLPASESRLSASNSASPTFSIAMPMHTEPANISRMPQSMLSRACRMLQQWVIIMAKAARKLFICPSDENPNFFYQNFKVFISYGYNRYMTKKKEFSDLSLPAHPMDRLSVKNPYPDKTHVLADNWGRAATKNNSMSLIALNFVDEYSFNINAVHATGMNSVFLDGHAALAVMSYWNPFTCANDLWNLSDSAALTPIYTTKP